MQQRASQRKKKQRPKKILDAAQKDDSAEDYSSGSEEAYSNDEDEGKSGYKKGGYHPVTLGDTFKSGRYKVIRKLGWGHFSTVWLVSDSKTNTNAALKIVKSVSHYAAAARDEIQLLKVATERDPSGEKFCVRLIDHFEHRGPHGTHVCMVLEALGCNLLDLLKMFNNRGLPIPMVKCIAKQILTGLDFLHRQCAIIHTDLKPENVLLLATPVILGDDAPPAKPAVPPPGAPLPPPDDKSAAAQAKASAKNAKKRQKAKAKRLATKTAEGALPPAVIQTSSSDGHSLSGSNKSISFHYASPAAPPPPHPALQPSQSAVSISAEHNAPEHPRLKNKPESAGVPLPASLPVTPQVTPQLQRQAAATRLDASITKLEAYVASETPDPAQAPASAAPATAPAEVPEPAKSDAPAAADASAAPPAAAPAAGATAAELGCPPLEPGMRRLAYDPKRNASRIADFGNACWVHKHFTDNVQTREYRSPEVIIGAKYNTTCDLWSMACMTFELLTGDLLFEPKESDAFTKNDDHLAQMVELLGRIPKAFALSGRNSKDFFTRNGDLRNISELNFWPLEKVLEEKYKYDAKDAAEIASFLGQMLKFNPLQRASAQECLRHSWLADAEKVAGNFYDLPRRRTKSAKPATPEESTGEGSDEEDASESDEEEGEVKSTIVP